MKTFLAVLAFSFASSVFEVEGVRKIELEIHNYPACGGRNIKLQLHNNGQSCEVQPKGSFQSWVGKLTWSGYSLGSCQNMDIDYSAKVSVITDYDNKYCPTLLSVTSNIGDVYQRVLPWQWFDQNNNNERYAITKLSGVREVKLQNWNHASCAGSNVRVKLRTDGQECTISPKRTLYAGQLATWIGSEAINQCSVFKVDRSTQVFIMTDSNDQICPMFVDIYMDDVQQHRFKSTMMQPSTGVVYNQRTNEYGHTVKQLWPLEGGVPAIQETTCPTDQDDFCPTDQMFAYEIAGNAQMNCLFECPKITSAPQSTHFRDFNGTGFRCVGVNFQSIQYGWCCRTKNTAGGLRKCSEVMSQDNYERMPPVDQTNIIATGYDDDDTDEVDNDDFDQNTEQECPAYGCPIENVETFYEPNAARKRKMCEPDCDYVMSEDTNNRLSGIHCTRTRRAVKEARFCCNDPNARSDLPSCDVARAATSLTLTQQTPIETNQRSYIPINNVNPNPIQQDSPASPVACPVNQANYHQIDGKCYYMENRQMNHAAANDNCRTTFDGQGRLYEPRNAAGYLNVINRIESSLPSTKIWIGVKRNGAQGFKYLSDRGSLVVVQWGNHQPDDYHWARYHPDNNGNVENCVELSTRQVDAHYRKWNDSPCLRTRKSICERT